MKLHSPKTYKNLVKQKLSREVLPWLSYPMTVQIDTTNRCGCRYSGIFCSYCAPQDFIQNGVMDYCDMPIEQINWIQDDIAKFMPRLWDGKVWPPFQFVCYFLNGDPKNEVRLSKILQYGKDAVSWLPSQIFSSATEPRDVHKFCDSNLDWVCITLSAPNSEVYKRVHRGDRFDKVMESIEYITKNAYPNQHLEVHYVITEANINYMKEWYALIGREFPSWRRVFSPLVKSEGNAPSVKAMGCLTLAQQEQAITDAVAGSQFWQTATTGLNQPCVLWGNAAITAQGHILNCCNWDKPDRWNYGNIAEYMAEGRSLKDYWLERLANKQRNPICRACNLKHPDWKQRLVALEGRFSLV